MPHLDPALPWTDIARAIHDSGHQAVVALTGGGSGALSALLQTPGASRSILAGLVPYSAAAMVEWLGSAPDQSCSELTARIMAMNAFRHARRLAIDAAPDRLVGVACTASLASDRPKRGDHRIHVAVQTARTTASLSVVLVKERRDRAGEEAIASELLLRAFAAAVGVNELAGAVAAMALETDEPVLIDREDASPALAELLLGKRRKLVLPPGAIAPHADSNDNVNSSSSPFPALFPGAFNPPHAGHLGMVAFAQRRLGLPVAWELSIANVDKPPLDFIAIRNRVAALRQQDAARPIVLTHAPTFREKAELFPGAVFVVGADTLARIVDPRYYASDTARRDEAIRQIAAQGCRFLAFGRQFEGQFQTIADLELPSALRALCDEVPPTEFREDVSSTELRTGNGAGS